MKCHTQKKQQQRKLLFFSHGGSDLEPLYGQPPGNRRRCAAFVSGAWCPPGLALEFKAEGIWCTLGLAIRAETVADGVWCTSILALGPETVADGVWCTPKSFVADGGGLHRGC